MIYSMAGHLSREMIEHYSHVRMAAKRAAVAGLESGLIKVRQEQDRQDSKAVN